MVIAMRTVEIWESLDGEWHARLLDPVLGPQSWELCARSRGSVIAEMRCRMPYARLTFLDRFRPAKG